MIDIKSDVFRPEFDEMTHTYRHNGQVIPSVTQILKPISEASYRSIPKSILETAAHLGTAVHAAIELHLNDDLDETSLLPEWLPYFEAYKKFIETFNPKVIGVEARLACSQFAGTIDLVCEIKNEFWIIDWKTSNKIMPQTALQTAAYEWLFFNSDLWKKDLRLKRAAVQLKDNGEFEFHHYYDPKDYEVFNYLLKIKQWMQENVR